MIARVLLRCSLRWEQDWFKQDFTHFFRRELLISRVKLDSSPLQLAHGEHPALRYTRAFFVDLPVIVANGSRIKVGADCQLQPSVRIGDAELVGGRPGKACSSLAGVEFGHIRSQFLRQPLPTLLSGLGELSFSSLRGVLPF